MTCTTETHDALKSSIWWCALAYVGTQDAFNGEGLELRNCAELGCGSTLSVPCAAPEVH